MMTMKKVGAGVPAAIVGCLFTVCAQAGSILSTLPTPTEEGVYVLAGATEFGTDKLVNFEKMSYVDWAGLQANGLPDNAKIRFTGGVLFDSLPQDRGYAYDFSAATGIGTIKSGAIPQGVTLVVPSGCAFRFLGATLACDADAGTYTLTKDDGETAKGILCDLELNGSMFANDAGVPPMHGKLTGTGKIQTNNFGKWMTIDGELLFKGTLQHGSMQQNCHFILKSATANATVSNLVGYVTAGLQTFQYLPTRAADKPPCTLAVESFDSGWGDIVGTFGENKITGGVGILVYDGNAVKIAAVEHKNMFIVADSTVNNPSFDKGLANVTIGNFGKASDGLIAVSPNVNLTTGFHWSRNFTVEYRYWTNVVNRGTLDMTKTIYDYATLAVNGYTPANLPQSIKTRPDLSSRSEVTVTSDAWTMPFDFGAADVNPARCETNLKVVAPERGTVCVKNETAAGNAAYPRRWKEYPILTYASTTSDFANWTITPVGWPKNVQVEKVVKDTGLYVRIRQSRGLTVILD